MNYDPIKNIFARRIKENILLRKIFFKILNLMFLRQWYVERELKNLFSQNKNEIKMLDAGTGFGQYSYFCLRKFPNFKIHSTDIETHHIEASKYFFSKTKYSGRIDFSISDLTKINFESEFDFILSVDVMEHILDDRTVFQNFHRALKPNGLVLINTPSIYGGSDTDSENDESFIGEHARNGYSVEEITEKLENANIKVEKITFTYGKIGMIAWRFGIKIPMKLLSISKIFFLIIPFYYLLTLWFTLILMFIDFKRENKIGAGLLILGRKK